MLKVNEENGAFTHKVRQKCFFLRLNFNRLKFSPCSTQLPAHKSDRDGTRERSEQEPGSVRLQAWSAW